MIEFKSLIGAERDRLREALKRNGEDGAALRVNPRDTSFVPEPSAEDLLAETISAIRSIPCHYSEGGV